jgi:hypothetical protein
MTDVIIQHLITEQKVRIKCRCESIPGAATECLGPAEHHLPCHLPCLLWGRPQFVAQGTHTQVATAKGLAAAV